jgi:hypothetical protein
MKSSIIQMSAVTLIYRPRPKDMVITTQPTQDITSVEQWFEQQANALKLLAPIPGLAKVKDVLERNLPERVNRISRHISEPESAENWLKIILKSSAVIRLWPMSSQATTIAVDCSGNLRLAQKQFELIQSPEFRAARRELGIDQHWSVVIPGFPLQLPKQSELLDFLYGQLSKNEQQSVTEAIAFYG